MAYLSKRLDPVPSCWLACWQLPLCPCSGRKLNNFIGHEPFLTTPGDAVSAFPCGPKEVDIQCPTDALSGILLDQPHIRFCKLQPASLLPDTNSTDHHPESRRVMVIRFSQEYGVCRRISSCDVAVDTDRMLGHQFS